ncbi:MAG: PDZ domain-containing protein [Planctomycetaceae bacterium]
MKVLHILPFAALLLVAPAFGQEPVAGQVYTGVLLDSMVPKNPHKEVGKCANCHVNTLFGVDESNPAVAVLLDDQPETTSAPLTLTAPDKTTRLLLQLPEKSGLIVGGVCPTEQGKLFGLKTHDIILKINKQAVSKPGTVQQAIASHDALTFTILRDGAEKELVREQQNSAKPKTQQRYLLGVSLGELDPVVKAQLKLDESVTVYIKQVTKDGAAAKAGLKENDILLSIDEKPVDSADVARGLIQKSKGEPLSLRFYRGSETKTIKIAPNPTEAVAVGYYWEPSGATDRHARIWSASNLNTLQTLPPYNHVWGMPTSDAAKSKVTDRLNRIEEKLDRVMELLSKQK